MEDTNEVPEYTDEVSEDTDKPPLPYVRGYSFMIYRHTPPPPVGNKYPNKPCRTPRKTLQKLTQFELCLSASPLEGRIDYQKAQCLFITQELAVGDGRGAQVVVVNTDLVASNLVAKIYDPLYSRARDEDFPSVREDVVAKADIKYSGEVAAYEELGDRLGGTIMPRYYGSWTMVVPVKTAAGITKRHVRLILIELIKGVSLLRLNPNQIPETHKSNVMVKAIEAEVCMDHLGVYHGDLSPRNIVCSGEDLGSAALRVVVIDFDHASVLRLKKDARWSPSDLPVSPITQFWRGVGDFVDAGWIPEQEQDWLWEHWGGSPLYQPVIRGQEDPYTACDNGDSSP